MRWLLAFALLFSCAHAGDLLLCIVTARRSTSYLGALMQGLDAQGASYVVVDVDNSTLPSVGAVRLERRPDDVCRRGYSVPCPMQRQGLDIVAALEICRDYQRSRWVGLIEDDMTVCDGGVREIEQVVAGLGRFKTARFAKFSRATVFPAYNIKPYARYVRQHVHVTPHDILLNYEWAHGVDYVHRVSLFTHQGKVSTIEERNDPAYMATYSDLRGETCGTPLLGK